MKHGKIMDTNTVIGWVHMYLAHLIKHCSVTKERAYEVMTQEANHALAYAAGDHREYQSDMQCVMSLADWYPVADTCGFKVHVRNKQGQVTTTVEIEDDGVDWWLSRL